MHKFKKPLSIPLLTQYHKNSQQYTQLITVLTATRSRLTAGREPNTQNSPTSTHQHTHIVNIHTLPTHTHGYTTTMKTVSQHLPTQSI